MALARSKVPRNSYRDGPDELPPITDEEKGNRPDYLLKTKVIRPGKRSRWATVGAAWIRPGNNGGSDFLSLDLNPCVILGLQDQPLCLYVNDGNKHFDE